MAKRVPEGMLGGMWEFPTLSVSKADTVKSVEQQFLSTLHTITKIDYWPPINHSYTHFKLQLYPILIMTERIDITFEGYEELTWKPLEELMKLPLHRAVWKVLKQVEQDLIAVTD